jgi:Cu/Ag efflux pump CusA
MINKIIHFSVNNKLITGVLLGIFVFWGIYSFTQLSVDALPDVTNNQVQVITNSPNLATQEVEQFITYPLETEFKSLQGLVELRSTSRSGLSVITIVFKDNMPINIIRQLVAEKIKIGTEMLFKTKLKSLFAMLKYRVAVVCFCHKIAESRIKRILKLISTMVMFSCMYTKSTTMQKK